MGGIAQPRYYLDTYAIIQFLKGDRRYREKLREGRNITALLNLIEVYYLQLRDLGEDGANQAFAAFAPFRVEITDDDSKEAMKLRLRQRASGVSLSYADAVGYAIAERVGAKFLTGDSAFEKLPSVAFLR